jgi:hypothetical protein
MGDDHARSTIASHAGVARTLGSAVRASPQGHAVTRVYGQCSANVGGDPVNGCDAESVEGFDYCLEHADAAQLREMARAARSWSDEHDCDDIPCPTYGDDCPWQQAGALDILADERETQEAQP